MTFTQEKFEAIKRRDRRGAAQYIGKARAAAARAGQPVPPWAASQTPPKSPAVPAPAVRALAIPLELAAWRSASSTRGFSLSIDGRVQLVDWQGHEVRARFARVAEALAAIAADTVRWRPTPRKVDPRHAPRVKESAR